MIIKIGDFDDGIEFEVRRAHDKLLSDVFVLCKKIFNKAFDEYSKTIENGKPIYENLFNDVGLLEVDFRGDKEKLVEHVVDDAFVAIAVALKEYESAAEAEEWGVAVSFIVTASRWLGRAEIFDNYQKEKIRVSKVKNKTSDAAKIKNQELNNLKRQILLIFKEKLKEKKFKSIREMNIWIEGDRSFIVSFENYKPLHQINLVTPYRVPTHENLPRAIKGWMKSDPEFKQQISSYIEPKSKRSA